MATLLKKEEIFCLILDNRAADAVINQNKSTGDNESYQGREFQKVKKGKQQKKMKSGLPGSKLPGTDCV